MTKTMKKAEIRKLKTDKLQNEILETKKKRFEAKIAHLAGQLKNSAEIRVLRRQYARLLTIASEKEAK